MPFQDLPIKRKVMTVILMTSFSVLLLTTVAFTVSDLISYRKDLVNSLLTTAAITADDCTAPLMFQDEETAQQYLGAVKAEPQIVAAALYDEQGNLFVR